MSDNGFILFAVVVLALTLPVNLQKTIIIDQPRNVTANEGTRVELTCVMRVFEVGIRLHWYSANLKDGCHIDYDGTTEKKENCGNFTNIRATLSNENETIVEFTLCIDNVRPEHDGLYSCGSSNWLPTSRSERVHLEVVYPPMPPQCSLQGRQLKYSVPEGDFVVANCVSSGGTPLPQLRWDCESHLNACNTTHVTNSTNVKVVLTRQLTAKDHGISLRCVQNHPLLSNEKECVIGPLNVLYKPKVEVKPMEYNVTDNNTVITTETVYKCVVDAFPSVTIYDWFVDGVKIDKANVADEFIIESGGTILHVLHTRRQDVKHENFVVIQCRAYNQQGTGKGNVTHRTITLEPFQKASTNTVGVIFGTFLGGFLFGVIVAAVILLCKSGMCSGRHRARPERAHRKTVGMAFFNTKRQTHRYDMTPVKVAEPKDKTQLSSFEDKDGNYADLVKEQEGRDTSYEPLKLSVNPIEQPFYENVKG